MAEGKKGIVEEESWQGNSYSFFHSSLKLTKLLLVLGALAHSFPLAAILVPDPSMASPRPSTALSEPNFSESLTQASSASGELWLHSPLHSHVTSGK